MRIGLSVLRMGKFLNEGVLRMNDILFGNNNGPILKKLTKRSLKANKRRNFFLVMAIMLTTLLIGSVFSVGMSLVESVRM